MLSGFILFGALVSGSALAQTRAPMIEVQAGSDVARAQGGIGISIEGCPCVRTRFAVEVGAGVIRVGEFIFSSNGLVHYDEESVPVFSLATSRTWRAGQFEAVHSGTGIGLAFDGVRFTSDSDRGFVDLVSSGARLLYRMLFSQQVYADLSAGYRWEGFQWNGAVPVERQELPVELALQWLNPHFRGRVTLSVAPQESFGFSFDRLRFKADLDTSARFILPSSLDFLGLGLGVAGTIEHDPLMSSFGMPSTWVAGRAYMEVSWLSQGL